MNFSILFLLVFIVGCRSNQAANESGYSLVSVDGENVGTVLTREDELQFDIGAGLRHHSKLLKLQARVFDPSLESIYNQPIENSKKYLAIVQFKTQTIDPYIKFLKRYGVEVYSYIPDHAVLINTSGNTLLKLKKYAKFFRAVTEYKVEYKMNDSLKNLMTFANDGNEKFKIDLMILCCKFNICTTSILS